MKILLAFLAGATLIVLAHILGWRWLGWFLSRIETADPADSTPRMRTWIKGVMQP
ncbi:hypothetical protein [Microbacterium sp. K5D]|uniref:hypothetical protein n=1 Tax=Microbacterium sp. K5D TaxID=2305436 RepID=UPI0014443D49|nr:hypothetical protein [Microbacterium sp. K5D]